MTGLTRLQALYDSYLETAIALEENRKPGEGLLGFGKKPADDPCHSRFAGDLEALLTELAAEEPDSAQRRELLSYIFQKHREHPEPLSVYWMLLAVHGQTLGLIPGLTPQDAAALRAQYDAAVPRRERLPVHREVYRALKAASRG